MKLQPPPPRTNGHPDFITYGCLDCGWQIKQPPDSPTPPSCAHCKSDSIDFEYEGKVQLQKPQNSNSPLSKPTIDWELNNPTFGQRITEGFKYKEESAPKHPRRPII